ERLALCKPGINRMPGNYGRLAKLPAEKNNPVLFHFPGEIDQALIDVFEQASIGFDSFRRLSYLSCGFLQLRVPFDYLRQRKLTCRRIELDRLSNQLSQFISLRLQAADSYFKPWNQLIRLIGRK